MSILDRCNASRVAERQSGIVASGGAPAVRNGFVLVWVVALMRIFAEKITDADDRDADMLTARLIIWVVGARIRALLRLPMYLSPCVDGHPG